ncbi:MAG: radical SAM protein, partial [Deltaproteobacteria bacterium]|nr:radical SAM protein [Deltaproteobacteria bacterium]
PDRELAEEYERSGTRLLSLETQRPMTDFELAAFSLSFENDYLNVLKILSLAGIPWRREEREDGPLILAGGVAARLNPEPLSDFLDLFLLGDGERLIPDLLRAWRETRLEPLPKSERLLHLARSMTGAYAPAFYEAALDPRGRLVSFTPVREGVPEKVATVRISELGHPVLTTQVMTPDTEFSSTRLVEISRGCGRGCRFCLTGFEYRPPRTASSDRILAALDSYGPAPERVGLVSPAVGDHPEIHTIVKALVDQKREVSVSSLRIDASTEELIETLVQGGLRSAAIAPEAGSERLRQFINKQLTEEQILDGVQLLGECGLKRIKLYFMIGLPTETRDDVRAIGDLVKKIKDRLARSFKGKRLLPELTLTVASFVPKPCTPFQTEPMAEVKELKARAKFLRSSLRGTRGVRVHFDVPKWAYLQAILSLGDRRVGRLIEALVKKNGNLAQALKEVSFNPDFFVTRHRSEDEMFPWDFIDRGMDPEYFKKEAERARSGRISPVCDPDSCRLCGLCPVEG